MHIMVADIRPASNCLVSIWYSQFQLTGNLVHVLVITTRFEINLNGLNEWFTYERWVPKIFTGYCQPSLSIGSSRELERQRTEITYATVIQVICIDSNECKKINTYQNDAHRVLMNTTGPFLSIGSCRGSERWNIENGPLQQKGRSMPAI